MKEIEKAIVHLKERVIFMENFLKGKESIGTLVLDKEKILGSMALNKLSIAALEKQLNNRWIPVDEKLPEETQRVLVTLKNECVCEVFYINNKFKFIGIVKGGGMKEVYIDNPVIAWQPLPPSYKEGEKC